MENINEKVEKLTSEINKTLDNLSYKAQNDINDKSFSDLLNEISARLENVEDSEHDEMINDLTEFAQRKNLFAYSKQADLISNLLEYHHDDLSADETAKLSIYIEKHNKYHKFSIEVFMKREHVRSFKKVFNQTKLDSPFREDYIEIIPYNPDEMWRYKKKGFYRIRLKYYSIDELIRITSQMPPFFTRKELFNE